MATTTQSPDAEQVESRLGNRKSGRGGGRDLGPGGGNFKVLGDPRSAPARTGIWVGLAAITMSFAAFTSALLVRQSTSTSDWHHLTIPGIVFVNTFVLLASSLTLEIARKRIATSFRNKDRDRSRPMFWLVVTLLLGLMFVAGQSTAWLRLRAEGLYLATNPNSSFFYVLTAMHAVHVLGGLGGLTRVILKLRGPAPSLRRSTLDATAYYWHFMGILWVYVLLIVWTRL